MSRTADMVRLLDADPDLGALLSDARCEQAERELVVRTHRLPVGPWDVSRLAGATVDHVGLLILSGVLSRELIVADHVSAELLGPGDLVRPWQPASRAELLPVDVVWSVLSPLTVAVLDRRFAAEVARYPEVTATLFDRMSERSMRLATTQAISQLTRVDRRLKALFWHLAERWGRVSGDGVIVPLALTHRILGQLVGARRPTVSSALSELAEREELLRRPDGSWLLRGDPPDAESLARKPGSSGQRAQDLMRPVRRFDRDPEAERPPAESGALLAAMERMRDELEPGELRDLPQHGHDSRDAARARSRPRAVPRGSPSLLSPD
jgi:CRP/FNR family transcriptional regulator, cyclic AMP receptor protein